MVKTRKQRQLNVNSTKVGFDTKIGLHTPAHQPTETQCPSQLLWRQFVQTLMVGSRDYSHQVTTVMVTFVRATCVLATLFLLVLILVAFVLS